MEFSRQEYWSGLPFPSPVDHILSDLSTMTRPSWVAPQAWFSFIELDTTLVLWSDWLVFCDYGFSVSALWCPLTTPTILLGFLLLWTWSTSSGLFQQNTAPAPYLGRGVSSHGRPCWPWTWSSSSQPSCALQQPLLGGGVAPLSCSPCPQDVLAPLGRSPWPWRWISSSSHCPCPWACASSSLPPPLT